MKLTNKINENEYKQYESQLLEGKYVDNEALNTFLEKEMNNRKKNLLLDIFSYMHHNEGANQEIVVKHIIDNFDKDEDYLYALMMNNLGCLSQEKLEFLFANSEYDNVKTSCLVWLINSNKFYENQEFRSFYTKYLNENITSEKEVSDREKEKLVTLLPFFHNDFYLEKEPEYLMKTYELPLESIQKIEGLLTETLTDKTQNTNNKLINMINSSSAYKKLPIQ